METYVIYHHGIKGMRWGIRRTPSQLGHDTSKKRRSMVDRVRNHIKTKKMEKQKKDEEEKKQDLAAKKTAVLKSRSPKELYDNAHLFTTQELQAAYNRLQLEKNIKSLTPDQVKRGKQLATEAIDWGKKANDMIETGSKLYNNVAKLYNTFGDGKTELPLINMGESKKFKVSSGKKQKGKTKNDADDGSEQKSKAKKEKATQNDEPEKVVGEIIDGPATSKKSSDSGSRKSTVIIDSYVVDNDTTDLSVTSFTKNDVSRGRQFVTPLLGDGIEWVDD